MPKQPTVQVLICGLLAPIGCLFDANDRCSAGEIFDDVDLKCVCEEGLGANIRTDIIVLDGVPDNPRPRDGCRICRFNETLDETNDTCVCHPDSVVYPVTGQCLPSYGTQCSDDTQCDQLISPTGNFVFGRCLTVSTSSITSMSFCSSNCQTNADCPAEIGFMCVSELEACVPGDEG